MNEISDEQWQAFDTQGYVRLGKIGPAEMVQAMRQRIDEIMLGEANLDYDRMLMQLDSNDGAYDSAGEQTRGHKGRTLTIEKFSYWKEIRCSLLTCNCRYLQKPPNAFMGMSLWQRSERCL